MDYLKFEVEDFATDDYFIRWVMTDERDVSRFWENFVSQHPECAQRIEAARALILKIRREERPRTDPAQNQRMWANIRHRMELAPSKNSHFLLKIAASISVIILLSVTWYRVYYTRTPNDPMVAAVDDNTKDFVEEINTTGGTIRMQLSDGSVVNLENNSRILYRKRYEDQPNREVYLTGGAFFKVTRNSRQPFLVYADGVVTKVLGTSFRVKAYENDNNIVVSVTEGKVSVYSEKGQKKENETGESEVIGVVLMPNQQVLYQRGEDSFNKTLVDTPQVLKEEALEYDFQFKDTPVTEVFRLLEAAYGVEMIFDAEAIENCYLTAPLGDVPLFEKLKIVCRTIGASYELIDAKIVISSKGCADVSGS